jgi:hypothetical protein
MIVEVTLNGTGSNPYLIYGLSCNPFPQIAKAGFEGANRLLADLAAVPIENVESLRERLKGCSEEFIGICCSQFKPGERVRFKVRWHD